LFLKLPYNGRVVRLTHVVIGDRLDDGEDDNGGSVGDDNMYKGSVEPILVLPSDSYSKEEISVGASKPSSCPTLHHLLTTSTTTLKNSI